LDNNADAVCGNIYFEMDNGNESREQLLEKIKSNYAGKGEFQVIFWMSTDFATHWKTKENIKKLDHNRLRLLFDVVKEAVPYKPNRLLGASYEQFLEDGKIYNYKKLIEINIIS